MSSPVPSVFSEYTHIKFDIADKSHCFLAETAYGFVIGLQTSADKTSLQFKEVVASRSLLLLKSDNNHRHEQAVWFNKGPFTCEQFLGLIKYKAGISNEEWFKHMNSCGVSVLPSGK